MSEGIRVPGYLIVSGRPLTDDEVAMVVATAREDWPDVDARPLESVSRFVPPGTAYLMRTDAVWSIPPAPPPATTGDTE